MKLELELVPKSTWGWNLRSILSAKQWDKIRRGVYKASNYHCDICGGQGSAHPVECHEKWVYDDSTHIQRLVGLEALCPECHHCRHMGRTIALGLGDQALRHMAQVNGSTVDKMRDLVSVSFQVWEERSRFKWTLDTTWIDSRKEQ